MKRKLIVLSVFFICTTSSLFSQNLDWYFGLNTFGDLTAKKITLDKDNSAIVIGSFNNSLDFDHSLVDSTVYDSVGNRFVAKYDSTGSFEWVVPLEIDDIQDVEVDPSNGDVYISGLFNDTIDFDPSDSVFILNGTPYSFRRDIFIAKYDKDGKFINAMSIGSTRSKTRTNIAIDNNNNVILLAEFENETIDIDPSPLVQNVTGAGTGRNCIIIAKYDNSLNLVWGGEYKGSTTPISMWSGNVYFDEMEIDENGDIYIVGKFGGVIFFRLNITIPAGNNFLANYSLTKQDIYVVKVNGIDGKTDWVSRFDEPQSSTTFERPNSSLTLDESSLYISGFSYKEIDLDKTIDQHLIRNEHHKDSTFFFLSKFDLDGNVKKSTTFSNRLPNASEIIIKSLECDDIGNLTTQIYSEKPLLISHSSDTGMELNSQSLTSLTFNNELQLLGKHSLDINTEYAVNENADLQSVDSKGEYWAFSKFNDSCRLDSSLLGVYQVNSNPKPTLGFFNNLFVAKYENSNCKHAILPTITSSVDTLFCNGLSANLSLSGGDLRDATQWEWRADSCNGSLISTTSSISVSPNVTSSYFLKATGGCVINPGCKEITIYVVDTNGLEIFSSDSILCNSDTTLLWAVGSGYTSLVWDSGIMDSMILTPSKSTTYSLTATHSTGCTFVKEERVYVYPNERFQAEVSDNSVCLGDTIYTNITGSFYSGTASWSHGLNSFENFSTSYNDSIIYVYARGGWYGCWEHDTVSVNINPPPNIDLALSDSTICPGDSLFFFDKVDDIGFQRITNHTFSVYDSTYFTPANKDYIVFYTNYSCSNYDTLKIRHRSLDNTITQIGNQLKAEAIVPNYQWVDCNNNLSAIAGATSQHFTPNQDGIYAVMLTDGNCIDTSGCYAIDITTAIDEPNSLSSINCYPNPTNGKLVVLLSNNQPIVTVNVLDTKGQVIFDRSYQNTKKVRIDLDDHPAGIYFIEVKTNDEVEIFKIVKK